MTVAHWASRALDEGQPAAPSFDHLLRLTDEVGVFEHAKHLDPRLEHGYCVDDVARALVVVARAEAPPAPVRAAGRRYLRFVTDAVTRGGRVHNRRAYRGGWTDMPSVEDCWGRALWGLGTAVEAGLDVHDDGRRAFERGARQRSPHLRSMAYAGLGAAEVLAAHPRHASARRLLQDAARAVDNARVQVASQESARTSEPWSWPEPRLRYANAVLPEVLIAAGSALGDDAFADAGMDLLEWLLQVETASPERGGHLSVTPAHGWTAGEARPAFDQQAIELAALADACARALALTGDDRWAEAIVRCDAWFDGHNDVGVALADPDSGGCRDGLELEGRNDNQGAESTLALISVRQQARRVSVPAR